MPFVSVTMASIRIQTDRPLRKWQNRASIGVKRNKSIGPRTQEIYEYKRHSDGDDGVELYQLIAVPKQDPGRVESLWLSVRTVR